MKLTTFLTEVGVPIGSALIMAFFIFLTLKYILESVKGQVNGLTGIIGGLENRVRMMNNECIIWLFNFTILSPITPSR